MEIYLVVRRKTLSICLEAKENWTVLNVKEQLNGILSIPPSSQQLFKEDNGINTMLEDTKTLVECGFNVTSAKPQLPATLGLAILETEEFEKLSVTDYSQPPELPDVMKPQTPAQASMTAKPE